VKSDGERLHLISGKKALRLASPHHVFGIWKMERSETIKSQRLLSVGVPGHKLGLYQAHQKYGKITFGRELVQTCNSIRRKNGFPICHGGPSIMWQ